MLNESQEAFIEKFEAALERKGKHPEFIAQQVASVIQQFEYANHHNESTENFGGGPERYAEIVGRELPRAHDLLKPVLGIFILLFGGIAVPQFLNGTFDWTLEYILFILLFIGIGGFGFYSILKVVENHFVEYDKNKISMVAYLIMFSYIILLAGVYLYGDQLFRSLSLVYLGELPHETSIIIGWVLLGLIVLALLFMKYWVFAIILIIFSSAPVVYRQFTDIPIDDDGYLILTNLILMTVILALVVIIGILAFIFSKRRRK